MLMCVCACLCVRAFACTFDNMLMAVVFSVCFPRNDGLICNSAV